MTEEEKLEEKEEKPESESGEQREEEKEEDRLAVPEDPENPWMDEQTKGEMRWIMVLAGIGLALGVLTRCATVGG